jgi:hypothetical protein
LFIVLGASFPKVSIEQAEHTNASERQIVAASQHQFVKANVCGVSIGAEVKAPAIDGDAPGVTVFSIPRFRIAGHFGTFQLKLSEITRAS